MVAMKPIAIFYHTYPSGGLNMWPVYFANYLPSIAVINTKHFTKLAMAILARSMKSPDFKNLTVLQFCQPSSLTVQMGRSSMFAPVSHVIKLIAMPEVIRVAAAFAFNAGVKNHVAIRDGLVVVKYPRKAMDVMRVAHNTGSYISITSGGLSNPRPALLLGANFYHRPKAFFENWRQKLIQFLFGDRIRMHSDVLSVLLCHAFGCSNSARALSF
jgi:hypothetical protein